MTKENYADHAREVFATEIDAMRFVKARIDDATFNSAIGILMKTLDNGGKIVVTGVGKNLHIAEKISATLASTGSTSVLLNPSQAIHGDLGILAPNDILIALSYSGDSEEIKNLIPAVRRLGIPIIALTGDPTSQLATCSEVTIPITVPREACPFNIAPTSSTTATLAMGDAIAMTLLTARGFMREDFAKLHPGGAIGRALLYHASDIMRKGEDVATVPESASIRDAILAMTKARAGAACVVAQDGTLLGIFTDGDFRRLVTQHPGLPLDAGVAGKMTKDPIRATVSQLAVDIIRILEKHHIDDLPIVDRDNKLAGLIDLQDLPKFKVF